MPRRKSKDAIKTGLPNLKPFDIVRYKDVLEDGTIGEEELHVILPEAYSTRKEDRVFYHTLKIDGDRCVHGNLLFNSGWEYMLDILTKDYEFAGSFHNGKAFCKIRKKRRSKSDV